MADLAVGLAKSVVEGALTKAQWAIKEDSKLRQSAQRDLVFITGEFQMMQSFLKLADGERTRNIVVRTWVWQIRELAYDVEDCIEFVLHLDNKSRWWRRLLPSFVAAATQPLDEAVAEIQQLKARVEYVSSSSGNARYSLISDSGSKPTDVQVQPAAGATTFNMLVEATDIKKHGDLIQLITMVDVGLQVISVWGTCGDLGTTSIIRKAYDRAPRDPPGLHLPRVGEAHASFQSPRVHPGIEIECAILCKHLRRITPRGTQRRPGEVRGHPR
uniref:Disease resistance N-terminal domain-containing protein n=1 Tax=Triticum urartu TaxID=4572 RepID=A0A8R7PLH2_TRIUA